MEAVIHYLHLKNQYYEKFYNLTLKFLQRIGEERWDEIDYFVDNRDRILNILRSFDHKIGKLFQGVEIGNTEQAKYRDEIRSLFDRRNQIARKIISLDLELMSKLDDVKSESIRELKHMMETSQHVGTFAQGARRTPRAS